MEVFSPSEEVRELVRNIRRAERDEAFHKRRENEGIDVVAEASATFLKWFHENRDELPKAVSAFVEHYEKLQTKAGHILWVYSFNDGQMNEQEDAVVEDFFDHTEALYALFLLPPQFSVALPS